MGRARSGSSRFVHERGGGRALQPRHSCLLPPALSRRKGQEGGADGLHAETLSDSECDAQTSNTVASDGGAFCVILKTVADTVLYSKSIGVCCQSVQTNPFEECQRGAMWRLNSTEAVLI